MAGKHAYSLEQPLRRREALSVAEGLGWFSIALGALELLAPRGVTRGLGLPLRPRTTALFGLREIAAGIGILTARNPAPWLWGRLAGDVVDLLALAPALDRRNPRRAGAAFALAAVAGVTLIDLACARTLSAVAARRDRRVDDDRPEPAPSPAAALRDAAAAVAARGPQRRPPPAPDPATQTRH